MSLSEIGHRVEEQRKRLAARRSQGLPAHVRSMRDLGIPVIPGLPEAVGRLARDGDVLSRWLEFAGDVKRGCIQLLGQSWGTEPDGAPDWTIDPVTGVSWESAFAFGIPFRYRIDRGDIKFALELNRLQYLQPIAAAASVTGDDNLARLCLNHVRWWIEANPPLRGVGWTSGVELAIRMTTIIVVASLLERHLTVPDQAMLAESIVTHAHWIQRFPSRYSSANNHRIAELAGLFVFASLSGSHPTARRWKENARVELEKETLLQLLPDGVGAEQSPSYTAFTMEWLLVCHAIAEMMGEPFSEDYVSRLAEGGQFLLSITTHRGETPRIGDDDEGRVIFDPGDETYVLSIAAAARAVGERPCPAPALPKGTLRDALLGTPEVELEQPTFLRTFPQGGYTVFRDADLEPDVLWILDHGPLGYLSIAAHGHADTLAVLLYVDGLPVFTDAGTYLYHAGGRWRDAFRGTAFHNTLTVDGQDSSELTGPFSWGRRANARLVTASPEETWAVTAEHDGYLHSHGVVHRRTLQRLASDRFLLTDTLVGDVPGPLPVETGFLVAPDLSAEREGSGWLVRRTGNAVATVEVSGAEFVTHERGEPQGGGWYSPRFGMKIPTTRLVCRGDLRPGQTLETLVRVHRRPWDRAGEAPNQARASGPPNSS